MEGIGQILQELCQFEMLCWRNQKERNVTSHPVKIQIGVPQGSILGPLLFLLYVNDIGNSYQGMILSFADDTTLITSSSNLNELFTNANIYINNLYEWFCSNMLSLNATKTKYIVLRPRHTREDLSQYNIHIGNTQLSRIGNDCLETSSKFIGMYLDENLTWKMHMNEINKKVSRALFSIKQVNHDSIFSPRTSAFIIWNHSTGKCR